MKHNQETSNQSIQFQNSLNMKNQSQLRENYSFHSKIQRYISLILLVITYFEITTTNLNSAANIQTYKTRVPSPFSQSTISFRDLVTFIQKGILPQSTIHGATGNSNDTYATAMNCPKTLAYIGTDVSLHVLNITNPANPAILSTNMTGGTIPRMFISANNQVIYFLNQGYTKIVLWNISNYAAITPIGNVTLGMGDPRRFRINQCESVALVTGCTTGGLVDGDVAVLGNTVNVSSSPPSIIGTITTTVTDNYDSLGNFIMPNAWAGETSAGVGLAANDQWGLYGEVVKGHLISTNLTTTPNPTTIGFLYIINVSDINVGQSQTIAYVADSAAVAGLGSAVGFVIVNCSSLTAMGVLAETGNTMQSTSSIFINNVPLVFVAGAPIGTVWLLNQTVLTAPYVINSIHSFDGDFTSQFSISHDNELLIVAGYTQGVMLMYFQLCPTNYWYYAGQCIFLCPNGTFANAVTQTCDACPNHAQTCFNNATCNDCAAAMTATCSQVCLEQLVVTLCYPGYYVASPPYSCTSCGANCSQCNSTTCQSCFPNSYLFNNSCTDGECPEGYYQNNGTWICGKCNGNCSTCSHGAACTTCSHSSTFLDNDGLCLPCAANCVTCSCGKEYCCLTCPPGMLMSGTTCVLPYWFYVNITPTLQQLNNTVIQINFSNQSTMLWNNLPKWMTVIVDQHGLYYNWTMQNQHNNSLLIIINATTYINPGVLLTVSFSQMNFSNNSINTTYYLSPPALMLFLQEFDPHQVIRDQFINVNAIVQNYVFPSILIICTTIETWIYGGSITYFGFSTLQLLSLPKFAQIPYPPNIAVFFETSLDYPGSLDDIIAVNLPNHTNASRTLSSAVSESESEDLIPWVYRGQGVPSYFIMSYGPKIFELCILLACVIILEFAKCVSPGFVGCNQLLNKMLNFFKWNFIILFVVANYGQMILSLSLQLSYFLNNNDPFFSTGNLILLVIGFVLAFLPIFSFYIAKRYVDLTKHGKWDPKHFEELIPFRAIFLFFKNETWIQPMFFGLYVIRAGACSMIIVLLQGNLLIQAASLVVLSCLMLILVLIIQPFENKTVKVGMMLNELCVIICFGTVLTYCMLESVNIWDGKIWYAIGWGFFSANLFASVFNIFISLYLAWRALFPKPKGFKKQDLDNSEYNYLGHKTFTQEDMVQKKGHYRKTKIVSNVKTFFYKKNEDD